MKWKRATALAALPLLAAALVGCGGDDDGKGDQESSQGSGSPSEAASTPDQPNSEGEEQGGETAAGSEVDTEEFTSTVLAAAEKITSLHVETTSTASALGASTSTGDFDYSQDPVAYHVKAELDDFSIETIAVGADSYVLMEDQWVKDDRLEVESGSEDPLAQLEELFADVESVTYTGEKEHDGATARVYEVLVTVDVGAVLGEQGAPGDAPAGSDEEFRLELWLDDADRVVRMDGSAELAGDPVESSTVLSAFDEPVTIEAPPAEDIME